ncbi:MAG: aspartate aminotransferase family protein [Hyphomicrobiales bacterium]|nr:aspartate aminotransferase family protein [Hyphomicrobiales bacterium]
MTDLYARDGHVLSSLQKLRFFPLSITGGHGSYVIDEAGRELLDLSASWGAASLGHSHPALIDAVTAALSSQAGASVLSATNEAVVSLAERLLDNVAGTGDRRVWFGHSGSDANETVARAVVAATGRQRIITFTGSYHGGTAGSIAVSGHSVQEHADKADGLISLHYPDPYRPIDGDVTGEAVLDVLRQRFETDAPPEEIAAIFIEPIQSDGGLIVPPPGFMKSLCDLCRQKGILVVSDEVKVGVGRTGRFSCYEHEDFVPDIVTMGKGLGGGLPLSAVIGPADVMNFATSFSMQTLHGNPICAAAGHAVLNTITNEGLTENAEHTGAYLMSRLRQLMQAHELIGDVRGRGLAIGVELVQSRTDKTPAARAAAKIVYRAYELGLVHYYVGMNSNVLEMTPPLNLSEAEADAAVAILDKAINDVVANRVPDSALDGFDGW